MHVYLNQMVKESKFVDSIEEVVCRIAASRSARRDAHGHRPLCDLWRRLNLLNSKPKKARRSGQRCTAACATTAGNW